MSLIRRMRRGYAVVWPFTGQNEFNEPTFGEPFEIRCRWDDMAVLFRTPSGDELTSKAVVYPDRRLTRQSRMYSGRLETLGPNPTTDPLSLEDNYEILSTAITPRIRYNGELLTVYLG